MQVISSKTLPSGQERITIQIPKGARLVCIEPSSFYKLGYPCDDQILGSHVLDSVRQVSWCSASQQWVE